MGLRAIAEQDLGIIMEDKDAGFGYDITLTAPDGTVGAMVGFSDDIAQVIDPDTGQAVSGRLASVAIRIGLITEKLPGKGLPVGIADSASKPWLVAFDDINGNPFTFKVAQSNPDRAIGLLSLILEFYTP